MYRIIKRIVQTVTTVTLLVRWEDSLTQETVEKQITLPASHSLREEEVVDEVNDSKRIQQLTKPNSDKGEQS
jgi:hypothetical protein